MGSCLGQAALRFGSMPCGPTGFSPLEKEKQIFSLREIATEGDLPLGFQFTDASDHLLTVVAEPERKRPAQQKKFIAATGPDTAQKASFRPMILFLGVLALGLAMARISRRGKIKKAERE
jgi:hypothetical protein